ncbi:PP2C family protein-serine/threonine phosphatase [Streptomyces gobitricini]|uniref:PPM-type phosphatase domain-containing protein n=1 Tax=Streptomyces gobitricini TaxID=68211 RepID=A0ABP5ZIN1_9ACTN
MDLASFRAVVKLLPHSVVVCTTSGRLLAVSPATRRTVDTLVPGADLLDLVLDTDEVAQRLKQWTRSGSPLPGVMTVRDGEGRPVRLRCHGARATWWRGPESAVQLHLARLDVSDRFVALSQRVSLMNQQMAYRRAMAEQRDKLLRAETEARARMQRLYRLTAALAASADLTDVCEAVHKCAPQALDAVGVTLELHPRRIVPSLSPTDTLPVTTDSWTDLDLFHGPSSGAPLPETDRRVPLEAEGVVLGSLVVSYAPGAAPDADHTTAIAQQIAQAVRRAGLFEHEHGLAVRLQRSLLPRLPEVSGLDIASGYAPGTHMVDVGGDWYDVHPLDQDTVGFTIGDVAGHGIAQATAMAQINTVLRSISRRHSDHLPTVMAELNDFLGTYHEGLMATACYATYHRGTRTLRYTRAGHPPPLLIHGDGTTEYLRAALAPPLGPVPFTRYPQAEITLPPGSTLVFYTDGLIERRGESLDIGLDRLARTASTAVGLDARGTCDLLLHQQPDTDMPDDRALLIIHFPPTAGPG